MRLDSYFATGSYIPPEAVDRAYYLVLDGICCALVGAHVPSSEQLADAIYELQY